MSADRSSLKSSSSAALSGIKRLLSKKEKRSDPPPPPPPVPIITPAAMPSVKQLNGNGNGAVVSKGKGKDSTARITAFISALSEASSILPELEALLTVRAENETLSQTLLDKERATVSALEDKDKALEKREKELQAVIDSKNALLEQEGRCWMDSIRQELSSESHSATLLQAKENELAALTAAHAAELQRLGRSHDAAVQKLQAEAEARLQSVKKELEAQVEVAKKAIVVAQTERGGYKARLEEVNAQLGQTKTLLAAEELHRQRREEELAKMQSDMGLRELVEPAFEQRAAELEARFHSLCKRSFHDLVLPFNPTDEYNEGLKHSLITSGFVPRKEATGDFPLMLTPTPWARSLLMAFAENIIATRLTEDIFRLVPVPEGSKKTLDYCESISHSLLSGNPANEARWRSLCCIAVEADPEATGKVIAKLLDQLAGVFTPLFTHSPDALAGLLQALADLFSDAFGFWQAAQHAPRRIVAEMALDLQPGDCEYHPEHLIPVPEEELRDDETSGPMPLPLFPRFVVLGEQGEDARCVFEGKALPPTANSAIRARAEMKKYKRGQSEKLRKAVGSGSSVMGRRRSVSTASSASGGRSPTFVGRTPVMARPLGHGSAGGSGASSDTGL